METPVYHKKCASEENKLKIETLQHIKCHSHFRTGCCTKVQKFKIRFFLSNAFYVGFGLRPERSESVKKR